MTVDTSWEDQKGCVGEERYVYRKLKKKNEKYTEIRKLIDCTETPVESYFKEISQNVLTKKSKVAIMDI